MIFLNLKMNEDNFYCKKCINHFGCITVRIGKDGICNHCKNPDKYFVVSISPENKERKKTEMEKILEKIRAEQGSREYDCVVAFSGGNLHTCYIFSLSIMILRFLQLR